MKALFGFLSLIILGGLLGSAFQGWTIFDYFITPGMLFTGFFGGAAAWFETWPPRNLH